ncbi:MAG: hypothetical protein JO058_22745 [Alphaproteobacteria bacterium]|nr:hypothetical protein [Alphaproteobacteria bacterium]
MKPTRSGKDRGAALRLGAATLGLSVLLAGCAEEKPAPTPGPFGQYIKSVPRKVARPATRQPGQAKATAPETTPAEETPPEGSAATSEQPSQPQPGPTAAPPEQTALAVPSSTDLLGLDPQHTRELLGPAAQTNKQSPATVWHYKGERCELDLSFYMEMRSGQMRTLHYNFKGEADSPEQRQACLRSIIEENRKPEHS